MEYYYETHNRSRYYLYSMAKISSDIIKYAAQKPTTTSAQAFPTEGLHHQILRQRALLHIKLHRALKAKVKNIKASTKVPQSRIDTYFAPYERSVVRYKGEQALCKKYLLPAPTLSGEDMADLCERVKSQCSDLKEYMCELELLEDIAASQWLLNGLQRVKSSMSAIKERIAPFVGI